MGPRPPGQTYLSLPQEGSIWNMAITGRVALAEKMFKLADGRQTPCDHEQRSKNDFDL